MIEHLNHNYKIKGSNPSKFTVDDKMAKKIIRHDPHNTMVQHLNHNSMIKGLNPSTFTWKWENDKKLLNRAPVTLW